MSYIVDIVTVHCDGDTYGPHMPKPLSKLKKYLELETGIGQRPKTSWMEIVV